MWKEIGFGLAGGALVGSAGFAVNESINQKRIADLNATHQEQLAEKDSALAEAEATLSDYRLIMAQQALALDDKQLELDSTRAQLSTVELNLVNANAEIENKNALIVEKNSLISEANDKISTLETEKANLQTDINNIQTELETNKTLSAEQISELEGQLSTLQTEYAEKVSELELVTADRDNLQTQVDTLMAEKAEIQTRVDELTTDKVELQEQVSTLEADVSNLNTYISTLYDEIERLQLKVDEYEVATSATLFTFNGGTLTGYTGEETDIIIPATYSLDSEGNVIDGTDISVTEIGYLAFWKSSITSVKVPSGVSIISMNAFSECSSLSSVVLPNSLETIGGLAFSKCSNLSKVNFPHSVKNIDMSIFDGCNSLEFTIYNNGYYLGDIYNPYVFFHSVVNPSDKKLVIHPDTVFVNDYAFKGSCIVTIIIPKNIKTLGAFAFKDCASLTEITFLVSVPIIPSGFGSAGLGFEGCPLGVIYIPFGTYNDYLSSSYFSKFSSLFIELNEDGSKPSTTE